MAHKTWAVGEKLLASDLNNNILAPAVLTFEMDNANIVCPPAFSSDWSRAFIRATAAKAYLYKNPDANKLDPFIGINLLSGLTNLASAAYAAYLSQIDKFIVVSGANAYLYNNNDTASGEAAATVSGATITSAQGVASDGANVFILDDLANQAATGTAVWNAGSNTITGTGTAFTTEFEPGDPIIIGGGQATVLSIGSNTSLTTTATTGSTYSGAISRKNVALKKFTVAGSTLTYVSQLAIPFRHTTVRTVVVDAGYIYIYGHAFNAGTLAFAKIRKFNKTTGALVSEFNLLVTNGQSRNPMGVTVDPQGHVRFAAVSVAAYMVETSRIRI